MTRQRSTSPISFCKGTITSSSNLTCWRSRSWRSEKERSDMSDRTDLDLFVDLSRILTGEKILDRPLASQYLERLKAQYAGPMQALLDAFRRFASDRYAVFEVKRQVID